MDIKRKRIGDINAKDIWSFTFKCLGAILFPILFLMPFIFIWRIFFYSPEDFWSIIKLFTLYIAIIVLGVWLCSFKTILETDENNLYIIKKWCLLFGLKGKKVPLKEIKQITFANINTKDNKWKTTLKKIFRLKLFYSLIYKLGNLLMSKGRMLVCIIYGEQSNVVEITDIKKNDERYLYLQSLKEHLIGN